LIEKRFFVALHGIGERPEGLDAQVKQLRADEKLCDGLKHSFYEEKYGDSSCGKFWRETSPPRRG
jgi:hypothetical protein